MLLSNDYGDFRDNRFQGLIPILIGKDGRHCAVFSNRFIWVIVMDAFSTLCCTTAQQWFWEVISIFPVIWILHWMAADPSCFFASRWDSLPSNRSLAVLVGIEVGYSPLKQAWQ